MPEKETPSITTPVCSALSLTAGEELFGTAGQAQSYLLLEYNDAWNRKAFEQSSLSQAVKAQLEAARAALPKAKILMIKSRSGLQAAGVSFFIVDARESSPAMWEFSLGSYEELLSIDIPAVFHGQAGMEAFKRKDPLYLVCTNGKRDPCCARFGLPVYSALLELVPEQIWQSSHVGGHRFAANFLSLPHGILYGRLSAETVEEVIAADWSQEIFLPAYRGRTAYPAPAQAGEYFLRGETGRMGMADFSLAGCREVGTAEWEVHFREAGSRQEYSLHLRREMTEAHIFESCGINEATPVERWRLEKIDKVHAAAHG